MVELIKANLSGVIYGAECTKESASFAHMFVDMSRKHENTAAADTWTGHARNEECRQYRMAVSFVAREDTDLSDG